MKNFKSSFDGTPITRKQALAGLGNPKTWEADAAELQLQFERKPIQKTPAVKRVRAILKHARDLGKPFGGFIGELTQPQPMFAGTSAKSKKTKHRRKISRRKAAVRSKSRNRRK